VSAKGTHWTPTSDWLERNAAHLRNKCAGKARGRHYALTEEEKKQKRLILARTMSTPGLLEKRNASISAALKASSRVKALALLRTGHDTLELKHGREDPLIQRLRVAQMHTPETRRRLSVSHKTSPLAKAAIVRLHALTLSKKPMSYPEILIARTLGSKWRYTGNGSFPIPTARTTRFPDFVEEGGKQIIEVFGDYWHRKQDPKGLIAEYAAVGWSCRVVWEHEII
jgi:hypothetical protein